MPQYSYRNEVTGEVKDVFQRMDEEHIYEENGVQWKRVFISPQTRVSSFSSLDPNSYQEFSNWIDKGKGGSVGDLWDASKELSEKRESQKGTDEIKKSSLADYSKTRNGISHPSAK